MKTSDFFMWIRRCLRHVLLLVLVIIIGIVLSRPGGVFSGIAEASNSAPGSSSEDYQEESWITSIEREAIAYYSAKYGDSDVTARVLNYGCHLQIDIIKNGKVIKSLTYFGARQFYELN